jgi:hypothetical protein
MRQHLCAELQDFHKRRGIQAMIDIIRDVRLQQAGIGRVVQLPTTIDEPLGDMTDFGDVKCAGNYVASGRMKRGSASVARARLRFEFMSFIRLQNIAS